ncbi:MAG: PorP/SprF family type IX secretion system membrane protein [Bacteroidales bacterium]|nr:PorP/SprF family type IX secretion system membrane protein [Bacteroidales bacterium]
MKKAKYIILFVLYFPTISIFGQDPNFSNFINNKIYYNPAYAGMDYGLRLNLAYRRLWPNIPSKFQTFYACFDQSIRITRGTGGFGFIAISNTEGEGVLQKITIGIPISARIPIAARSLIQVGVMPSFSFNSINWDQFVFSGQLNPYYGNIYPSAFIPPNDGSSDKSFADIFNVGCVFRYENKSSQANSFKLYRKFEIGLSGFHLSQPNQSFTHSKAPISAKYVFFANYTTSISLNYHGYMLIEPSVLCERQWKMFSYMMGVNTSFTDFNIDFGIWWRNKNINLQNTDAIIVLFGYRFTINKRNNTILTTSLSYDITVSQLSDVTGGSPEITLILAFNNSSFFHDKPDVCDEGSPWMNKKKKIIRKK